MNWHDMTADEQKEYVAKEAARIARRYSRLIVAAGKRSEKKVGAEKSEHVAERVAQRVKHDLTE